MKVFSWDEKFELTQIQISCWKKWLNHAYISSQFPRKIKLAACEWFFPKHNRFVTDISIASLQFKDRQNSEPPSTYCTTS